MQPAKRGAGSLWSGPLQGAFCQAEQGGLWDFASVWAAASVRGRAGVLLAVEGSGLSLISLLRFLQETTPGGRGRGRYGDGLVECESTLG